MSIKTSSFMAQIEIAYAVQSIAESHDDKAMQSVHWVGKVVQTECKIAKLERFAEVPPTLCKIVQT